MQYAGFPSLAAAMSLSHVYKAFCVLCALTAMTGVFLNFQTKQNTGIVKSYAKWNLRT
jgi:cytochrome bd-type quinol oxidase subunit 2